MSSNIEFKHMEQGIWIKSNTSHFIETNIISVKNQWFFIVYTCYWSLYEIGIRMILPQVPSRLVYRANLNGRWNIKGPMK